MFKSTITFSQLKSNSDHLTSLQSKEVLQVLHRGSEVKVVMTQEHYFYLLAMLERNNFTKVPPHDEYAMRAAIAKRTAEHNEIVTIDDPIISFGPTASDYNPSTDLVYRNPGYMAGPIFSTILSNGPQGQSTTLSTPDFTNLVKTQTDHKTTVQTSISFNGQATTPSIAPTDTNLVDSMNGAILEPQEGVDLVSGQLLKRSFWK